MEQTEGIKQNEWIRVAIIILLFIFIGLGGMLYLINSFQKTPSEPTSTQQQVQVTVLPTKPPTLGRFTIAANSVTSYKVGQSIPLTVTASSDGKDIAGFDLLVTYDPAVVSVARVMPVSKEYQISAFTKKKGEISITATKINTSKPNILNNSQLVTITVVTQKPGTTSVELKSEIGNERTKFIDEKYNQFTPELSSIHLDIL